MLALAWGCLAMPGAASAIDVGADQLIAIAGEHGLGCTSTGEFEVRCSSDVYYYDRNAVFSLSPISGLVSQVSTNAREYPLSTDAQAMMSALHSPGCGDPDGISRFVAATAALTDNQQISDVIGDCAVTGKITLALEGSPDFTVTSQIRTPPPPTDTPTPTPSPTSTPTTSPTPTITPAASETTTPSPTTRVSATSTPTPTERPSSSATAGSSSSTTATATPTTSPGATPEQEVLGGQGTPGSAPSAQPAAGGTNGSPERVSSAHGALALALVATAAPRLEPLPLVGSALLVLALLFFMAFAAELFNSTLDSNYDEVAGWFSVWRRRTGGASRFWGGPAGIGLFMLLGAVVYAWLDPDFGPSAESAATLIGLLLGLIAVMISFELPGMLMYRRRTGDMPGLRALPWTLVAAAVCVAISRVENLQPGYLYGLLLGIVFAREPTGAEEGRQTAVGAAWTLGVSLVAWVALAWVRGDSAPVGGLGGLVVETSLAVVVVGGLEAVAFGLLPMRFLAGQALYRWSRPLWAVLFGLGTFSFIYLLIGPHSGYLSELPLSGLIAAFGVFAMFGTVSVLFWGYFRFRRERTEAT
jgi:hypothetical protein